MVCLVSEVVDYPPVKTNHKSQIIYGILHCAGRAGSTSIETVGKYKVGKIKVFIKTSREVRHVAITYVMKRMVLVRIE